MPSTDPGASSAAGHVSPTGSGSGVATNPKMRKRTKTGCLTCRKRRIKCGEERPTCGNCIKSKRQCDGYNQRVIFKTPLADWPSHSGPVSELPYHSSMLPGSRNPAQGGGPQATQPQDKTLTSIRPRPLTNFDFSDMETGLGRESRHYQQPLPSPHHQLPTPTSSTSSFPLLSPAHAAFSAHYTHEANVGYAEQPYPLNHFQQNPVSYDTHVDQKSILSQAPQEHLLYQHHQQASHNVEDRASYHQLSSALASPEEDSQHAQQRPPLNNYGSNPQRQGQGQGQGQRSRIGPVDMIQAASYRLPSAVPIADFTQPSFQSVYIPSHNVDFHVKYVQQHAILEQPIAVPHAQQHQPQLLLSGFGGDDHVSPTQILNEAAVEYEDDDYWDVQSDEDMLDREDEKEVDMEALSRDYSLIQRIHLEKTSELAIRRYDAFIYDGILAHYKVENVANPLKNPKTARVFAHFIHITGPSLSIYERNPRNPTSIFDEPSPPGLQSLWTDILPFKALNHQGLLHAMLALSSLHIARLQKASVTPSWKHYAFALKQLGRSLGSPQKRLTIETLSTSLLLAFYEVMTAEHVKWSTHLVGSAHLLAELDFRSLTQQARQGRAEQTAQEKQFPYQNPDMLIDQRQLERQIKESASMPDEAIVSTILGTKVSYDDFGRVFEEESTRQEQRTSTTGKFDLASYETLQDLHWWYARNDAYQSIVSGNPLIMPYRKWSDCPPRAPLGRGDSLYGTHDHIILLIGRIADFTVRDRARKLRQVDANGGQWRPTPGMPGMAAPPQQGQGQHYPPPTPIIPMSPPLHMHGVGPPHPGKSNTAPEDPAKRSPSQMPPPSSSGQKSPLGTPAASAMPGFYGMAPTRPPISLPASYANPNFVSPHSSPSSPNAPHPEFSDVLAAYEAALSEWNSIMHAHATVARFLAKSDAFAPLPPDLYPPAPSGNMTPFGPPLLHRSYSVSILWTLVHVSNILLLRSHPAMPPAAIVAAAVCAPATLPYAMLIGRIVAGLQMPTTDATSLTPSVGAVFIESTMSLFFAGIQYQDSAQRAWLIQRLLDIDRRTGWASAGIIARSCETSWERAAELGRGAPYPRRRTRPVGEEGPIERDDSSASGMEWSNQGTSKGKADGAGRDEDNRTQEREARERDGPERGFVVRPRPWAMNLLATDDDLRAGMGAMGISDEINVAGTGRERSSVAVE